MSATNRGAKRRTRDAYPTPGWCSRLLIENVPLPGGDWLEPCSGDGAIIREASGLRPDDVRWSACEIRRACAMKHLPGLVTGPIVFGDFLKSDLSTFGRRGRPFDVAITNPPFSIAQQILEHALTMADMVVLLLRLNFLEGGKRSEFLAEHMPTSVWVLPNRPSFCRNKDGKRGTDATAYAWMVWTNKKNWICRTLMVLPTVPIKERRG